MIRKQASRAFTVTAVKDGVTYEVKSTVETLRIAADASTGSLTFIASAWKRDGNSTQVAYSCYYAAYSRTGSTYKRLATGSKSTTWNRSLSAISVASAAEAVVIFIADTAMTGSSYANAAPSTYLAKVEIRVVNDGAYYVNEYARGTSRTNYAPQYIEGRSVTSPYDGSPGWSSSAPLASTTYPYIWQRTALYHPDTGTVGDWVYICLTGIDGSRGKTGRMFYLAGKWSSGKSFARNDNVCPVVEHSNSYWYLDVDSSQGDTPSNNSTVWKKAEHFGVVLTEALFTQFAKLGGFIVAGDFFISQFGELFASDDYTDVNSKSLAEDPVMSDGDGSIIEDESGMVPYMYFYSSDPSVMNGQNGLEDNELRFRPTLCINSVTGAMFMARGNVTVKPDGEVVLKNTLFASSIQSNALDTQSVNKRRIHIEGGRMEVYNDAGQIGLSLGWDANGDPYLQVAKVGSDGTVSKAYKLTYDGVSQASASMTSDIFTSRQLNRAGGSAKTIYNNTSASYYYNYSAARNTVTSIYSTENPSGGAASTLYQTYRSQQDGRWFTTNTKTYVISSSGSEYRIPDGYYIAASGGYNSSTGVYSRALYNANEGIIAQVGTVYFKNPTSGVGLWCDADGSNGKQAFDVSRYLSQRDRLD